MAKYVVLCNTTNPAIAMDFGLKNQNLLMLSRTALAITGLCHPPALSALETTPFETSNPQAAYNGRSQSVVSSLVLTNFSICRSETTGHFCWKLTSKKAMKNQDVGICHKILSHLPCAPCCFFIWPVSRT